MGIANKLAGIFSQRLFGGLLLAGGAAATPQEELQKVEMPYMILTAVLVVLAALIWFSKGLPDVSEEQEDTDGKAIKVNHTSVFSFPNLVLGVIALFCYVGVEVISGDTISTMVFLSGFPKLRPAPLGPTLYGRCWLRTF
jgi:FHS family L-fucose permease-like MFS transporter